MSAVVGWAIRAAGSRRAEPLEPLSYTTVSKDNSQLSTNASAYHTRQVVEGNPLPLSPLAGSSGLDLHCDYNVFGSAVEWQRRHPRTLS